MRTDGSGMYEYLLYRAGGATTKLNKDAGGIYYIWGGKGNFKRVEEGTRSRSMILQSEDDDANIRVRGDEW